MLCLNIRSAVETIEEVGKGFLRNTNPLIANYQTCPITTLLDMDNYGSLAGAVFDRVLDEVLKHLLQPQFITIDDQRRSQSTTIDRVAHKRQLRFLHNPYYQCAQIQRAPLKAQLSSLEANDIEQRTNHPVQTRSLLNNNVNGALIAAAIPIIVRHPSLKQLSVPHERCQRRLQLMGGDREKLVA